VDVAGWLGVERAPEPCGGEVSIEHLVVPRIVSQVEVYQPHQSLYEGCTKMKSPQIPNAFEGRSGGRLWEVAALPKSSQPEESHDSLHNVETSACVHPRERAHAVNAVQKLVHGRLSGEFEIHERELTEFDYDRTDAPHARDR
jgi:hypothetical protein